MGSADPDVAAARAGARAPVEAEVEVEVLYWSRLFSHR